MITATPGLRTRHAAIVFVPLSCLPHEAQKRPRGGAVSYAKSIVTAQHRRARGSPANPAVPEAPVSPAVPDPGKTADPEGPADVPAPEEPATPSVPQEPTTPNHEPNPNQGRVRAVRRETSCSA